jgi:DNA-binding transcriptional ArsR family regulator
MSGIFSTKNRILDSLAKKPKTRKQLSEELKLSPATVSQHLEELIRMGLINKSNDVHSKRWMQYEVNVAAYEKYRGPMKEQDRRYMQVPFMAILAILVVMASSFVFFSLQNAQSRPNSGIPAAVANESGGFRPGSFPAGAGACPIIRIPVITNISSFAGFSMYNTSGYHDYVINRGSSGTLNFTLTSEGTAANSNLSGATLPVYNNFRFSHEADNSSTGVYNATTPGLNVTLSRLEENMSSNSTASFLMRINVSASAPYGTYWVSVDECDGISSVFLITIGNGPYAGNVIPNVNPIA